MAGRKFVGSYASDLKRALETAEVIGDLVGIRPEPTPALREIYLGAWEGLRTEEIAQQFPDAWAAWVADPDWDVVPGGEGAANFDTRVGAALDELLKKKHLKLDAVIELRVNESALLQRVETRAAEMRARGEEVRVDDTPEVLTKRLAAYRSQTEPLIHYYSERRKLLTVDGMMTIEEVTREINRILTAIGAVESKSSKKAAPAKRSAKTAAGDAKTAARGGASSGIGRSAAKARPAAKKAAKTVAKSSAKSAAKSARTAAKRPARGAKKATKSVVRKAPKKVAKKRARA